jgi:hypothetical protein
VRKDVQHDVGELHYLVAHSAVVKAGALAGGYWFVRSGWVAAIDVLGSIPVAATIPAAPLTGRLFQTHPQAGAGRGGPAAAPTPNAYVAVVRNPQAPQSNSVAGGPQRCRGVDAGSGSARKPARS